MSEEPTIIDVKLIGNESYGNVLPLLYEVGHALEKFQRCSQTTTIDLRRIPMTQADEQEFEAFLGEGEVNIEIETLGQTKVRETKFPGVWHIVHYNADDEIMGKFITVAAVPDLVLTQPEDAARGLRALNQQIESLTQVIGVP